jgi:hypothetical protein
MLTILVFFVGAVLVLVLILLAIVVVGIRQEPPAEQMTSQPPTAMTAWVRRLLGVYVRRPDLPAPPGEDHAELCLTGWDPPRWPQGPAE